MLFTVVYTRCVVCSVYNFLCIRDRTTILLKGFIDTGEGYEGIIYGFSADHDDVVFDVIFLL